MPELNTRLFQEVYDQIVAHPELHEQVDFEGNSRCGATRCVASWAILIDAHDKGETITSFRHSAAYRDSGLSASPFARRLLGITYEEANHLFYQVSNEEAVGIVKAAAQGVRPPFTEED